MSILTVGKLVFVWSFYVLLACYMASNLWRGLRSGEFLWGDDGPATLVRRTERPIGFWALAALLAGVVALCIYAPFDATQDILK